MVVSGVWAFMEAHSCGLRSLILLRVTGLQEWSGLGVSDVPDGDGEDPTRRCEQRVVDYVAVQIAVKVGRARITWEAVTGEAGHDRFTIHDFDGLSTPRAKLSERRRRGSRRYPRPLGEGFDLG